jgi:TonB family protein
MGSIVLYIIEWAFALLVLLAIYKAAFSGTTLYRFNRFYLLGATLLSALLPLVHLTIPESTPLISDITIQDTEFAQGLSGTFIFAAEPQAVISEADVQDPASPSRLWAVILVCTYAAYVGTLLVGWSRGIIKARRFLKGKPRRRLSRTVWLVTHQEAYGPFSWMNYIVISDMESGFARRASLRHEFSHVRLMHSIDLIILLACTIVNPVCWLVLQEIKIVHEFEADDEVINRYGIHEQDYQRLLLIRTVGAEAYALASSFNLNIKKRIIMMNKNKTRKRRIIWLLLLIPMLGMTSVLFARTEKAVNTDNEPVTVVSGETAPDETFDINSLSRIVTPDFNREIVPIGPPPANQEEPQYRVVTQTVKAGEIISGVVTDADSDAPITMANVVEVGQNDSIFAHQVTDNHGNFRLRIVNPNHQLRITYPGYMEARRPIANGPVNLRKESSHEPVLESAGFPGGMGELLQHVRRTVRYPAACRDSSIQGRVIVSFTIDEDGTPKDPEVVTSVHPLLDAEAIRVINAMPKWIPARSDGKPVSVKYTIPINFSLSNDSVAPNVPQWIYLSGANIEGDQIDQEITSLVMSWGRPNAQGSLNTPQVEAFVKEFNKAQEHAQAINDEYQQELESMQKELEKRIRDYEKARDGMSAELRSSYEKELGEYQFSIQKKHQEMQQKMMEWSDQAMKELQPHIKAAWQSVTNQKAYIYREFPNGYPANGDAVSPENLESAVKELVDGKRKSIIMRYSRANSQMVRNLFTDKYSDKMIFYRTMQ